MPEVLLLMELSHILPVLSLQDSQESHLLYHHVLKEDDGDNRHAAFSYNNLHFFL